MDGINGEDALGPLRECAAQVLEDLQGSLPRLHFQATILGVASAAAAERGDTATFERLMDSGAKYQDSFRSRGSGRTMIACASAGGSAEIVERLLREGGQSIRQLNLASGRDGATPVLVAVQANAPEVVNVFLRSGANPNLHKSRGVSPLHMAAIHGHRACGVTLLQSNNNAIKVDVNARDSKGRTSIYEAVRHGRVGMVEDLLSGGAHPSLTPTPTLLVPGVDRDPELGMPTCLGLAASEGNRSMVDALIAHSETSSKARERIPLCPRWVRTLCLHFAALKVRVAAASWT